MQPNMTKAASTEYEEWMEREDIPVHEALCGIGDVTELPRRAWGRMGGTGAFIQWMHSPATSQTRGLYVAEIPGGGALNPERHFYEEAIFMLKGRGLTEVWHEEGNKVTFEWGEGSIFSLPLNTWHRLVNGSREPAVFLATNTAPLMMNTVCNTDFIFGCDFRFTDRFRGAEDHFSAGEKRFQFGDYLNQTIWETNFIPDARGLFLDSGEQKVAGGQITGYRMGKYWPNGHLSQWEVGKYHKAHYHLLESGGGGGGTVLLGLSGSGYVLLWPHELGWHPYENGHEDQVVRVPWGPRSVYTPPRGWFHQHFNTSKEPARHIAMYGGANMRRPEQGSRVKGARGEDLPSLVSLREGGTLLEYEDEDPRVRQDFEEALTKEGIEIAMPPVTYRK